ncbi:hypothetical protein [Rufibacter tibetensis]|uniref:Uncharacterized protein n=1 Tax=Rufibacter tibetensis TaxID=512763 RepID=A0A0P0CZ35_9BACT|nr:hypothetical protein [Rufibacter tibetensis]ALJ00750.1 hypothetical protein DC20_19390 [Rufibacter tibetensis]
MGKTTDIDVIVQTLKEAQKNKDLLEAMISQLDKFVNNQRIVLNEIEILIANAKNGELEKKSGRGGYRGRKKKEGETPEQ